MKPTGLELITQERAEQLLKHRYTKEQDVELNKHYQLSEAAGMLTVLDPDDLEHICAPSGWNEAGFNKMMAKPYKERLIIAGALLAAEIDRLAMIGE